MGEAELDGVLVTLGEGVAVPVELGVEVDDCVLVREGVDVCVTVPVGVLDPLLVMRLQEGT